MATPFDDQENILYRDQITPDMAAQDLMERATEIPPLEPISQPNNGIPVVQDILSGINPLEEEPIMSYGQPAAIQLEQPEIEPLQLPEEPKMPTIGPDLSWAKPMRKALKDQSEVQAKAALDESKLRYDQAQQMEKDQLDLDNLQKQWNETSDKQLEKIQEQSRRLADTKIKSRGFFDDMSGGQKVFAGVSIFLMSLTPQGQALAMKMIDSAINRDLEIQKQNLANLYKGLENDKDAMKEYNSKMDRLLKAQQLRNIAVMERMKVYIDAKKMEYASQEARANGDLLSAKLDQAISASRDQFKMLNYQGALKDYQDQKNQDRDLEKLAFKGALDANLEMLKGRDGGKMTVEQGKAFGYAKTMQDAMEVMDRLERQGYDPTASIGRLTSKMPREAVDSMKQIYDSAASRFAEAFAHSQTGANAPKEEWQRKYNMMMPLAGESIAAAKEKKLARLKAVDVENVKSGYMLGKTSADMPKIQGIKEINEQNREEILRKYFPKETKGR